MDNNSDLHIDPEYNWDESFKEIQDDADEAFFDVITSRVQAVVNEWLHTPIWAKTPEDLGEPMLVSTVEREDSVQTKLGELAAVQFLGVLAQLCTKADVAIDPRIIYRNKDMILDAIGCLMVEGVMVANAPEWSGKMDKALGNVRKSRWTQTVFSPNPEIVKQRDDTTTEDPEESPGNSTEA